MIFWECYYFVNSTDLTNIVKFGYIGETKYQTTFHCDSIFLLKSKGADVVKTHDMRNTAYKVIRKLKYTWNKAKTPEVTHKQGRTAVPIGYSHFYFKWKHFVEQKLSGRYRAKFQKKFAKLLSLPRFPPHMQNSGDSRNKKRFPLLRKCIIFQMFF